LKIERIRNILNRNLQRRRFYHWVNYATLVVNLEDAVFKTSKTIRRRKLRNAFNKYRQQAQEVKRAEYVAHKVNWFEMVRGRKSIDICFDAWKEYIKMQRTAKIYLKRACRGVEIAAKNEAFELWKKMVFSLRK